MLFAMVILGGLSWGKSKETNELLWKLNGRLFLIQGNHGTNIIIKEPGLFFFKRLGHMFLSKDYLYQNHIADGSC